MARLYHDGTIYYVHECKGWHEAANAAIEKALTLIQEIMTKDIKRDDSGIITEWCLDDMREHLPIKVYVNDDKEAHKVLNTEKELEGYFKGALPYVLTTRYEYD